MKVTVRYFAAVRESVGKDQETVIFSGRSAGDLHIYLKSAYPSSARVLDACAIAVNLSYADLLTTINEGDEVALIPPVSGG